MNLCNEMVDVALTRLSVLCLLTFQIITAGNDPLKRSVAVGQTTTLPCSIDTGSDTTSAVISWLSPNQVLLTMNYTLYIVDDRFTVPVGYQRERNLRISNVRVDDAGTYTCKVSPGNRVLSQVELVVTVPPRVTYRSPHVTVRAGSDVTLMCNATGVPAPEVTWFVGGLAVGNSWSLTLKSLSRDQVGWYSCVADNKVPPAAHERIKVDLLYAPELALPYRELRQHAGSDAFLTCLVQSNPEADVYWERHRDGQQLKNISGKHVIQRWPVGEYSALYGAYITSLDLNDFGAYRCFAKNEHGAAEAIMVIYALNSTDPPTLPAMDCKSNLSAADSTLAALIVLATLLAVAMAALGATLFALQRARREAATISADQDRKFTTDNVTKSYVESTATPTTISQSLLTATNDDHDVTTKVSTNSKDLDRMQRFNSSRKCTKM